MAFRFVHTADVHLDSPLISLALRDPDVADVISNATRQTFVNTVDLCLEEEVDAFLIAGDLYDGDLRSIKTAAFLTEELRRLTAAGICVFIIKGNHDAESKITKHLLWPEGVHVFSGRGEAVTIEDKNTVVHGISFAQPHAPESLLLKYKARVEGAINVGLLHTSLAGSVVHDVYSPCSVQELVDQRYDYWALGHIHKREVHAEGPGAIVMPGIPQGRHINESGPKSVTLVEIADDGRVSIEERFTSVAQFERLSVNVSGLEDWADLVETLESTFGAAIGQAEGRALIVRLALEGASILALRLRRDRDVLLEETRAAARRAGSVFLEKLEIAAEAPSIETKSAALDPVRELRKLIDDGGPVDHAALRAEADAMRREVQLYLPPELRDRFGADDEAAATFTIDAMNDGVKEVLAHLESEKERD